MDRKLAFISSIINTQQAVLVHPVPKKLDCLAAPFSSSFCISSFVLLIIKSGLQPRAFVDNANIFVIECNHNPLLRFFIKEYFLE